MAESVSERPSVPPRPRVTVGGWRGRTASEGQRDHRPGGAGERSASSHSVTELMEPVWVIRTGAEPEGGAEGVGGP